jgi:hypothetical protein
MTFKVKEVTKREDGTFDIEWETPEDFEIFKKMAIEHCKGKKYTDDLGNKYVAHVMKLALEKMN